MYVRESIAITKIGVSAREREKRAERDVTGRGFDNITMINRDSGGRRAEKDRAEKEDKRKTARNRRRLEESIPSGLIEPSVAGRNDRVSTLLSIELDINYTLV